MRKLLIQRHKIDDQIQCSRLGDIVTLSVGYECDPLDVQRAVHAHGGVEYEQIIFDAMLPENKDTCNNAYILTRLRN